MVLLDHDDHEDEGRRDVGLEDLDARVEDFGSIIIFLWSSV